MEITYMEGLMCAVIRIMVLNRNSISNRRFTCLLQEDPMLVFEKKIHYFKVLSKRSFRFSPKNATKVILATVILHNYLRLTPLDGSIEINSSITSIQPVDTALSNNSTRTAISNRNFLCEYLNDVEASFAYTT
ncbi:uncharacterized protein [Musca autumnalis]|uniref:uncharacterized protein n=1 Tax=Musca autumnalis TaxID=221902 RepID=UPI003CE80207